MKSNTKNGTTEEKSGRNKNRLTSHSSPELGGTQEKSGGDGVEQNRTDQSNSRRGSHDRTIQQSNNGSGKILERLEFIQREYSSYLKEHQQRLQSRLEESKERERVFEAAMQELEHEVRTLISQDEFKQ